MLKTMMKILTLSVTVTHTCTYAHRQTHTPKYNGWNILPKDNTLISAFNCTSSNIVIEVCIRLVKDLQSPPEPNNLCLACAHICCHTPPPPSQPHSLTSLKKHSCPYKGSQNTVYSLTSSEFQ